jgi:acyl-CoA reductase-like NAD-dependent aldehyde dehydrogenase
MVMVSTNPACGYKVLGEVNESTPEEIESKFNLAYNAQQAWYDIGIDERLEYLSKFREAFIAKKGELSKLIAQEMGMPIKHSLPNFDRAIAYIDWSINHAKEHLTPETSFEDDKEVNLVIREPLGVVACISPWNFPASNFVWACFQALIAGNTVVFKNSEEVQLFAKELEVIFQEADFPEGVFNVVYGDVKAAQKLISCDIDLICFTGSTAVGQILYKQAAEKFIPAVLEMGGSDPAIIFEDADIENAVNGVFVGRFSNCGQVCCSSKRLIVHESCHDEVVQKLLNIINSKIIGDPLDEQTDIGPLAAKRQLDLLKEQVEDARSKGATIASYNKDLSHLSGAFYKPTIITEVTPDMRVWHEEVFGPVLAVVKFSNYDGAIQKANDTIYGLGASVFTKDKELGKQASKDIKAGMVKVNQTTYSKPSNPFGGCKFSGIGRENGKYGFHDVTQIKVVALDKS